MLRIRLQRTGRNHETTFRIVLTDSQNSTKSGKYLEMLGNYDPRKKGEIINTERILYWISKGAKPTDTLHNLLIEKKIITGKKVNVLPRKTPVKAEATEVDKSSKSTENQTESKAEAPAEKASEVKEEVKKEEAPVV